MLTGMTPLEYVKAHVHVTNTYRLINQRIFKLHANTTADTEYIETQVNVYMMYLLNLYIMYLYGSLAEKLFTLLE